MDITAATSASGGFTSPDRLIRFAEARRTLGLSKSTVYRMLERGELPCPVKIGALTYFSERELQGWITNKLAARMQEGRE